MINSKIITPFSNPTSEGGVTTEQRLRMTADLFNRTVRDSKESKYVIMGMLSTLTMSTSSYVKLILRKKSLFLWNIAWFSKFCSDKLYTEGHGTLTAFIIRCQYFTFLQTRSKGYQLHEVLKMTRTADACQDLPDCTGLEQVIIGDWLFELLTITENKYSFLC